MKKEYKILSLGILIGAISMGIISVGASIIFNADEISFESQNENWKVSTVSEAISSLKTDYVNDKQDIINSLKDKGLDLNNNSSYKDIKDKIDNMGGTKIYYLGTGTSFNIKTKLPDIDYTQLNANNFIIGASSSSNTTGTRKTYQTHQYISGKTTGFNLSKSYNATTGVLTVSGNVTTSTVCNDDSYIYCTDMTMQSTATVFAYLIIGDIQ